MSKRFEAVLFPELNNLSSDGKSNIVFDVMSSSLLELDDVLADLMLH